jgi:hypothetical protein
MSMPACEHRALDAIDKALAASEPGMAAMFAIFAGLSGGEGAVTAERLSAGNRPRWQPGTVYLLIPGMLLAAILATLAALLAGSLS